MARSLLAISLLAVWPLAAAAQTALPLNEVVDGAVAEGQDNAVYRFTAEQPGILTVAVRTPGGASDLYLEIAVAGDGDAPADAMTGADSDFLGDASAEQVAAAIPQAGEYDVRIGAYDSPASFRLIASFIPFAEAASEVSAPTPVETQALELGTPVATENDGQTPQVFSVNVTEPGMLLILTRGEGDITFTVADATGQIAQIDTDTDGVGANESAIVDIPAAGEVLIRVEGYEPSRYVLLVEHKPANPAMRQMLQGDAPAQTQPATDVRTLLGKPRATSDDE